MCFENKQMDLLLQLLPRESLHLERLGVLLHCFSRFIEARGCGSDARFSIESFELCGMQI